ncbi:hypothetical protein ACGFXC_02915 [Streptomyces sp. NPDC048507]|uniref:hypothetical protein n=1 Tax=Streptomyces sp. NPDC048507 TaxID=3365560 RepID=UPI0037157F53
MVTARAQHPPPPARLAAGLLELLGLALLLLGLICTHGAHATGAVAAPVPVATVVSVPAAAAVSGHGAGGPADECAPVPPRQGSVVDAPPAPPSGSVTRRAAEGDFQPSGPDRPGACRPAPGRPAAPAVLRI